MNINVVIFRVTLKAFDWTTEKTISKTFEDARDFEQFEQSIEEQANFLLNWVEKHEPFWYPILDDILVDDYKHYEMILEQAKAYSFSLIFRKAILYVQKTLTYS